MGQKLRVVGLGLAILGVLVVLINWVDPLQQIWKGLVEVFNAMPAYMQWGMGLVAVGLVVAFFAVVSERLEDREKEKEINIREE